MNPIDSQIDRLFRAAARHEPEPDRMPPYGLKTRVMAAWGATEPLSWWNTSLLVRGLILASLIMALSLWPVLSKGSSPFSDYLQLADSSLPANITP